MTLAVDIEVVAGSTTVAARFTADPGITALLGPSGIGKSLTLGAVAGIVRPRRGTIAFDGLTWADAEAGRHLPSQQRRVGMVFQDGALLPHRTVVGNVELGLGRPASRAARRVAAQAWLERVGIAHRGDSSPLTLSGGERQRVALARALATEPRLLLLDEPFSAVDIDARAGLRRLVREIVDEHGLVAVLVTHDTDDLDGLVDSIVRLGS